ncbi:MAG TPA: hypothetical protein VH062_02090 [Polyangiaceae bacterium]|jgi:hypothetical protein|nr:hypothetical protein [Polyangiaceae bacterium]
MLKEVYAQHLNRNVKFGRTPPVAVGPRLHFARYAVSLPTPAATCSYSSKALAALRDVMGNDRLGDCVIAGLFGHSLAVFTGNAGALYHTALPDIIKWYSAIGGYNPKDPSTDRGCDEETALNYAVKTGFPNGTKASGWVVVDATNKTQVMQALELFETVVLGMALPDEWISPFPANDSAVWDVAGAPNPENGHCVVIVGYNAAGVQIATWGLIITLTWAALKKYAVSHAGGEAYALLTPDLIGKGQTKAASGFDWAGLLADFNAFGGNVPVPKASPTLAQFQAWANAGIAAKYHAGMTAKEAEAAASAGIAANAPL